MSCKATEDPVIPFQFHSHDSWLWFGDIISFNISLIIELLTRQQLSPSKMRPLRDEKPPSLGNLISIAASYHLWHFFFFSSNISLIFLITHFFFIFLLLFICAYKAWFISPPCPHHITYVKFYCSELCKPCLHLRKRGLQKGMNTRSEDDWIMLEGAFYNKWAKSIKSKWENSS
jgi:hypothetical protein